MTVRVFGQPELHRRHEMARSIDPRLGMTVCGVRFIHADWPKGHARPRLPRCAECFA